MGNTRCQEKDCERLQENREKFEWAQRKYEASPKVVPEFITQGIELLTRINAALRELRFDLDLLTFPHFDLLQSLRDANHQIGCVMFERDHYKTSSESAQEETRVLAQPVRKERRYREETEKNATHWQKEALAAEKRAQDAADETTFLQMQIDDAQRENTRLQCESEKTKAERDDAFGLLAVRYEGRCQRKSA